MNMTMAHQWDCEIRRLGRAIYQQGEIKTAWDIRQEKELAEELSDNNPCILDEARMGVSIADREQQAMMPFLAG